LKLVLLKLNVEFSYTFYLFNPLNAELNPICHLLALLGAHHILHVGGLRVEVYFQTSQSDYMASDNGDDDDDDDDWGSNLK
jgi:hypothetical protein